jgi:fibro-slime domain-containing protein
MFMKYLPLVVALGAFGCSNDNSERVGEGGSVGPGGNGGGGVTINTNPMGGSGGSGGKSGTSVAETGELNIVVRDFKLYDAADSHTNPDFENVPATDGSGNPVAANTYWGPWNDLEIVTDTLGDDYKPVYKNASGTSLSTHGKAAFDQWFNSVDGTNIMQQIPMTLVKNANGTYSYDSRTAGAPLSPGGGFFPIDDGSKYKTDFGNQGKSHNYSFTVEIHTVFTYNGGETFQFSGDDDVFVYINNKRVINLGGIHSRLQADVAIDSLGLKKGETYPLDFFYAERHVVDSNLLITTSLGLTNNTDIPIF